MLEEQRRLQARNRDLEERLRQLRAESEGIIAELTAEIEKLRDLMKQAVRPTAPPSLWSKLQLESLKKPSTLPTLAPAPNPASGRSRRQFRTNRQRAPGQVRVLQCYSSAALALPSAALALP